jgi:hypothetical protein
MYAVDRVFCEKCALTHAGTGPLNQAAPPVETFVPPFNPESMDRGFGGRREARQTSASEMQNRVHMKQLPPSKKTENPQSHQISAYDQNPPSRTNAKLGDYLAFWSTGSGRSLQNASDHIGDTFDTSDGSSVSSASPRQLDPPSAPTYDEIMQNNNAHRAAAARLPFTPPPPFNPLYNIRRNSTRSAPSFNPYDSNAPDPGVNPPSYED